MPALISATDAHGCGPDSHVASLFLGCLFSRLTEVGAQSQAALQLQHAWRTRSIRTNARANLQKALKAARIQAFYRARLIVRSLRATQAARKSLRRSLKARVARTRFSKELQRLKAGEEMRHRHGAKVIQKAALNMLLNRKFGGAAIIVQSAARGMAERLGHAGRHAEG